MDVGEEEEAKIRMSKITGQHNTTCQKESAASNLHDMQVADDRLMMHTASNSGQSRRQAAGYLC